MNENKKPESDDFLYSIWRDLRSIRSQIMDIYPESIEADEKIGSQLSVIELALMAVENKIEGYRGQK